jgi:hypothetical protein
MKTLSERSVVSRVLYSGFALALAFATQGGTAHAAAAGAAFTTFDKDALGCLDSKNGINCNHYTEKSKVHQRRTCRCWTFRWRILLLRHRSKLSARWLSGRR